MAQGQRRVAVIANRDREQIDELKAMLARSGASVADLPTGSAIDAPCVSRGAFDVVLLKLTTHASNRAVFDALRAQDLRYLNTVRSVKLCQSRRATFAFANRRAPDVRTPRMFARADEAQRAIAEGRVVWVRRDAHNIPLDRRVLGVARTAGELRDLAATHPERSLFFQEFLGDGNETYKAYVVGAEVVVCRRTATAVEFVAVAARVAQTMLRVGAVFGMSVYGVDFFLVDGEVIVLDVNDFPSFRGVPQSSRRICDFVATRFFAQGR